MSDSVTEVDRARDSRHFSPVLRVALLVGVLVHLLGFFIFRVASNPLPVSKEASAFITLVETTSASEVSELMEKASLFDSAPLFIPGEWSSASEIFSSGIVRDWRVFQDFEPDIELADEVRPSRLSLPQVAVVKEPADLLDLRFWNLYSYFGQKEVRMGWTGERRNSVALVSVLASGGKHSGDLDIRLDIGAESEQLPEQPIIIFLNMAAPGLPIGAPLLRQSSGFGALDEEVLEWLNRPATLAKLPGGFLRLRVFL